MIAYIELALTLPATIYGKGEVYCGDYDNPPVACSRGAVTASGEPFNPQDYTVAIAMPRNRRIRPVNLCLRNPETGFEVIVRINDKMHERWLNERGFDITPAVYEALTGKKATKWSSIDKLERC